VTVAGVDGCRGGWVVATRHDVRVVTHLGGVLDTTTHLGIDMPIGLPAVPGRAADREARAFLGPRRSSVFPTPARPIVGHTSHQEANAAGRQLFGSGVSVQTFNLFAKIREVDTIVQTLPVAQRSQRIIEVHPECSFRAMTGVVLPAKRTAEGLEMRRRAISEIFGDPPPTPRGASVDDVLDAYAVLWSVERFAAGDSISLPGTFPPVTDEFGIAMRIVV
jgi:predicted RNase H-like nuclease